ncbi:ketoacyl-ACP synthase III [bacterium]|nr:beta-ketoacyl-ACP synthase III [Candidatus Celaenobacter polaris]TSA24138.1 MAG: ketoacyl-ACP synthase III [bacterium]
MSDIRVKIDGVAMAAPDKVLTNKDLEKIVDTSDEWIRTRTGMVERRITDEHTAASDVTFKACEKLFKKSSLRPRDIDLIVVATVTPDHPFPSTACILQNKLGIPHCPAFDISAGCTGFIYALTIAKQFIENGSATNALVIGVELLTKITNWTDRNTCVLFGDGAGAALLTQAHKGEISEIIDTYISSDGRYGNLLIQQGGGSRNPASKETVEQNMHTVYMEGNKIFKIAVKSMGDAAVRILERNGFTGEDVDWLIPHQANLRIIDATAKRIHLLPQKVIINIEKYGNTSSASIPIAFAEAIEDGRIRRGDLIVLDAFGAGLTWGSVLLRY